MSFNSINLPDNPAYPGDLDEENADLLISVSITNIKHIPEAAVEFKRFQKWPKGASVLTR